MKQTIHTYTVFDFETLEVIEDHFYEFEGEVAQCGGGGGKGGGGGSSTTTTVDYEYNSRMAALSEEQQDWAREYFNMWQEYNKPYEIAQVQANAQALPLESNLYQNQLQAATELLPTQQKITQQALQGLMMPVDVNERMALAQADVSNSWANTQEANNRAMARIGVNPNSGRFQGTQTVSNIAKAAQMAGARTQARVGADQENYARLLQAGNLASQGMFQGINMIRS